MFVIRERIYAHPVLQQRTVPGAKVQRSVATL